MMKIVFYRIGTGTVLYEAQTDYAPREKETVIIPHRTNKLKYDAYTVHNVIHDYHTKIIAINVIKNP